MYIAVANLVSFPGHVVLKRSAEAEWAVSTLI